MTVENLSLPGGLVCGCRVSSGGCVLGAISLEGDNHLFMLT